MDPIFPYLIKPNLELNHYRLYPLKRIITDVQRI